MPLNPNDASANGQYRILRLLGRGGFGFVYQAQDAFLRDKAGIMERVPAVSSDEEGRFPRTNHRVILYKRFRYAGSLWGRIRSVTPRYSTRIVHAGRSRYDATCPEVWISSIVASLSGF